MKDLEKFSESDLLFLTKEANKKSLPVSNLTRNYYFKAVKYAISGIDKDVLKPEYSESQEKHIRAKAQKRGLNPNIFMSDDVYAYNKYTARWVGDAIDNFGTITKPDSVRDFQKWFDMYAYNGGHPFEIYPYVCLYVRRHENGKFYLELQDFDVSVSGPSKTVLKMFLALRKAKVSVALVDKKLLLEQIQKYNLLNR